MLFQTATVLVDPLICFYGSIEENDFKCYTRKRRYIIVTRRELTAPSSCVDRIFVRYGRIVCYVVYAKHITINYKIIGGRYIVI